MSTLDLVRTSLGPRSIRQARHMQLEADGVGTGNHKTSRFNDDPRKALIKRS